MQLTSSLVLASAALSAGVTALDQVERVHALVRSVSTIELPRGLRRRDEEECADKLNSYNSQVLAESPPTADPSLLADYTSYLEDNDLEEPTGCDEGPEITGSLGESWSSYASEVTAWASSQIDDVADVWDACSDYAGDFDIDQVKSSWEDLGLCTTLVEQITGGGGGGDGDEGAAPRQTAAAMAAMGVAGMVAMAL